jgi:hypothetical protein
MTKDERYVLIKAHQWWNSYKPVDYAPDDHLGNPRINMPDMASKQLATAVARYIKGRLRTDWRGKL